LKVTKLLSTILHNNVIFRYTASQQTQCNCCK